MTTFSLNAARNNASADLNLRHPALNLIPVQCLVEITCWGYRLDDHFQARIRERRKILRNPYAYLNDNGEFDAVLADAGQATRDQLRALQNPYAFAPGNASEHTLANKPISIQPIIDPNSLIKEKQVGKRLSRPQIESIARRLQIELWRARSQLFPNQKSVRPLDVLDPLLALNSIGFKPEVVGSIGQYSNNGELFEVAGIINRPAGEVQISGRFSPAIRNFTAAHELAHAILHEQVEIHRDRALDGTQDRSSRDDVELEADVFAAYFLMPEKLIRAEFEQRFLTPQFVLDNATAFALNVGDFDTFRTGCRTVRDLTRFLANATQYDGTLDFDGLSP